MGWGVTGAAVATVFSQGVSAVLCYFYMYRKFDILKTEPSDRRFRPELARQLMYIGVPMGLQFSITAIGSIMLQSANNALGTACVAAFTAAMRIKKRLAKSHAVGSPTHTPTNPQSGTIITLTSTRAIILSLIHI